jgi:hypothetical protein
MHSVVFKWPKVGTCTVNVNFELLVLFYVELNKVLVGLARDRLGKIGAELSDTIGKFSRGISDRRGEFSKFDTARPKLFVNRAL